MRSYRSSRLSAYLYFLSRGNIPICNDSCTSFECYSHLHIHVDQSKASCQKAVVILLTAVHLKGRHTAWPSLMNYITEKQVQAHLAMLVTEHYSCALREHCITNNISLFPTQWITLQPLGCPFICFVCCSESTQVYDYACYSEITHLHNWIHISYIFDISDRCPVSTRIFNLKKACLIHNMSVFRCSRNILHLHISLFSVQFYTLPYKFEGVFPTKEGVIIHSMHILQCCLQILAETQAIIMRSLCFYQHWGGVGAVLASFTELHLVRSENVLVKRLGVGVTGMSMFCSHLFKGRY